MQIDQMRVEEFLDDGWSVIGQLHQWLSNCPRGSYDRATLTGLISGVQAIWAKADDLGLTRIARTSLALEQSLERFCARTLELTTERFADVTAGVEGFQEQLLGLEATREETDFGDPIFLQRLERHSIQPIWIDTENTITDLTDDVIDSVNDAIVDIETTDEPEAEQVFPAVPSTEVTGPVTEVAVTVETKAVPFSIERTLLTMLEQFVITLDDTCHDLHARAFADESPYVTTTSRLEYLSHATRELVKQITGRIPETAEVAVESLEKIAPLRELPLSPGDSDATTTTVESTVIATELDGSELNEDPVFAPREIAIANFATEPAEPMIPTAHSIVEPIRTVHRVLIVEESLFYRHLISLALQSAGYESESVDSMGHGADLLKQQSFSAVLVGSIVSSAMSDALEQCRRDHGIKVIGLVSSTATERTTDGIDDQVVKSHPQRLISVLDQLLGNPTRDIRKSA